MCALKLCVSHTQTGRAAAKLSEDLECCSPAHQESGKGTTIFTNAEGRGITFMNTRESHVYSRENLLRVGHFQSAGGVYHIQRYPMQSVYLKPESRPHPAMSPASVGRFMG